MQKKNKKEKSPKNRSAFGMSCSQNNRLIEIDS